MLESLSLPKLGIKGAGAEGWLPEHGIDVPPATYDSRRLSDGGLIVRLGTSDFFLEGGSSSELLPRLAAELATNPPRVYRVERHDATYLVSGPLALKVLAQLCSFDFRSAQPGRAIMTRAGGVNCTVLPDTLGEIPQFRLWVDCTFAAFFWEMLTKIAESSGGA